MQCINPFNYLDIVDVSITLIFSSMYYFLPTKLQRGLYIPEDFILPCVSMSYVTLNTSTKWPQREIRTLERPLFPFSSLSHEMNLSSNQVPTCCGHLDWCPLRTWHAILALVGRFSASHSGSPVHLQSVFTITRFFFLAKHTIQLICKCQKRFLPHGRIWKSLNTWPLNLSAVGGALPY